MRLANLYNVAACQRSGIASGTAFIGSRAQRINSGSKQAWPQQRRRWRAQERAAMAAAVEKEAEVATTDSTLQPSTSYSIEADDSREFAVAMAKVAWETKADDILVLHVAPICFWTRHMLICTVFSRPQLGAVLAKMEKEAEEAHGRRLSVSPTATSGGWELLDWGDVVVHILTQEQREYYDLETFYGAAEEVTLPFGEAAADVDTWAKKL